MVRKALRPDYYKTSMPGPDGEAELLGVHHINHCIDAIRQSLMCSADVSTLAWQWSEERNMHMEKGTILHTCRDFNKIRDWAEEHRVKTRFDPTFTEMNDPLDPATWVDGYAG
jgi:hypothetical protein